MCYARFTIHLHFETLSNNTMCFLKGVAVLHSKLAMVNVKGNMMEMKMGIVTGLINDRLALFHCCLHRPSLELVRLGKRWVPATPGAEAAIKHSLTLPFSCFCIFLFLSSPLVLLLFLWFPSTASSLFLKHKTACVSRRFGGQSLCLYFPSWLEVLGHCW